MVTIVRCMWHCVLSNESLCHRIHIHSFTHTISMWSQRTHARVTHDRERISIDCLYALSSGRYIVFACIHILKHMHRNALARTHALRHTNRTNKHKHTNVNTWAAAATNWLWDGVAITYTAPTTQCSCKAIKRHLDSYLVKNVFIFGLIFFCNIIILLAITQFLIVTIFLGIFFALGNRFPQTSKLARKV